MKLINKFSIWYIFITSLVMVIGGVIIFYSVEREIDKEEARDLKDWIESIAVRIEKGHSPRRLNRPPVEIVELDYNAPLHAFAVRDTMAMHEQHGHVERQLKGSASFKIRNRHFLISTYNTVVESDDIVEALLKSLTWIFLLVLAIVVVTDRVVSKRLLLPFNRTLETIRAFSLMQKQPIRFEKTGTQEFNDLNRFLEKMTVKALGDYQSLKEFTENASHEMQTPLAVIRGKLELLLESNLDDRQAAHITSSLDALEKLARTGRSLTLLSKLENREFDVAETVDLSEALTNTLAALDELILMKSLTLTTSIEKNVAIRLHSGLLPILLNNLLSNAIRHNVPGGSIHVLLTRQKLVIENSGLPPDVSPQELFHRFKKGNQSSDSSGLGLAIVKQICEISQFKISYSYGDRQHILELIFVP